MKQLCYFLAYALSAILWLVVSAEMEVTEEQYDYLFEMAKFSSVSYCISKGRLKSNKYLKESSCPLKFCQETSNEDVEVKHIFNPVAIQKTGSGFIALDHSPENPRIIVVFRGTSSFKDWLSDFDIKPVDYKPLSKVGRKFRCEDCKVHEGFYTALKSYCRGVLATVTELKDEYPDYQLVVTGHSLGAALTILAGIEFQLMGYDPLVISFASPRIGDYNLATYIDEIFDTPAVLEDIESTGNFDTGYIRVVHKGDYVAYLPPYPFYYHSGVEYIIKKKELPPSVDDLACSGIRMPTLSESPVFYNSSTDVSKEEVFKLPGDILHHYEHTNYFVKVTGCNDDYSKRDLFF